MTTKHKPLTARRVATLKTEGRFHDFEHRGLYLQIGPTGTKSWLLRFEHAGRERWMGLGSIKDFSLKEARERARAQRQLLAQGLDPIEVKIKLMDAAAKESRERLTFKQAANEFLNIYAKGWKNAKHRAQWRTTLAQHAFPKLGGRSVASIDAAMINEAIMPIWARTPVTAKRVRGRIERVVEWVKNGKPLPTTNGNGNQKHHDALPWKEVPEFMSELRDRQGVPARALEFAILTAARTGQVLGASWDEIDFDAKTWIIPATRMKAAREHRVPLSAPVIQLLGSLPREDGNPLVFIGSRAGAPLGDMAMREVLRGLRPVTVHGFRSSFKDWCSEATATPNTVSEMALAHAIKDKTDAAYRRGDLLPKRAKLMSEWAPYCASKPAEVADLAAKRKATTA